MIIQALKKIRARYWLLLIAVLCLGLAATHGVFIIESSQATQVSLSSDSATPSYSTAKRTRHIKIVRSGKWYIAAKLDNQVSATVQQSSLFMIPQIVRLEPKPQRSTQKLSSVGGRCLLYDNSATDTTVSGSCTQGSQIISKIIGDSTQQIISGAANIIATQPSSKGFMYILSAPYGSTRYAIGEFDTASTKTATYFNGELATTPQLIVDTSTGFVSGALLDKKYISQAELARSQTATKKLSKSDDATIVKSDETTIYTLNGTDSGRYEGETDESTTFEPQTMRTYKKSTGKLLTEIPLSKKYYIRNFSVRPNSEVVLIGETANANHAVICYNPGSQECEELWGTRDAPETLVLTNNLSLYVTDGSVWSYNQQLKQSELIYKAEGGFVADLQVIDGRYYISTKIPNGTSDQPYSSYQLLLSKNLVGSKRFDSLLPAGEDDAFINQHRGFITAFSFDGSLSKNKVYKTLTDKGITADQLSDFQVQLTKPTVVRPLEKIVIGFPEEGE